MAREIIYSILDDKGDKSSTTVWVPDAVSAADAETFAGLMADLIDDVIGGQITRIGIILNVALPGTLKVAPAAGMDVEEGARFIYRSLAGFLFNHRLATFLESKISANSRDVDQTDAAVILYRDAMVAGIDIGAGNIIKPSEHRNDDLTSLSTAREDFTRSRR